MTLMVQGCSVDQGHQCHQQRSYANIGRDSDTKAQQQHSQTSLQHTKSNPMQVQTLIVELREVSKLLELVPGRIVLREDAELSETRKGATLLGGLITISLHGGGLAAWCAAVHTVVVIILVARIPCTS